MVPDPPFDHVIITRFSVRFRPDTTFGDDWLAFRWNLLMGGLGASLAGQSVRDFTWLVFFDVDTPDWLRAEVAEASRGLFTPIWHEGSWVHEPIRRAVGAVATRPYLITTRIDSDDAVSRSFVEEVQARFAAQESLYVNLMHGVQVDPSGRLYHAHFVENAFISYIEKRLDDTPPRTVFWCMAHEEASSFGPVLNIVGPPRWMQVIHGTNLANSLRGLRAHPGRIIGDFDVDLPVQDRVGLGRFVLGWAESVVRLAILWFRHPTFALVYFRAQLLRMKGTTTVPVHVHAEREVIVRLRKLWRRRRS